MARQRAGDKETRPEADAAAEPQATDAPAADAQASELEQLKQQLAEKEQELAERNSRIERLEQQAEKRAEDGQKATETFGAPSGQGNYADADGKLAKRDAKANHDKSYSVRPLGGKDEDKLPTLKIDHCCDESEAIRKYCISRRIAPSKYRFQVTAA